ncbi:MAG: hypothetical protein FWD48_09730 [Oscillospiraceae bacterium]|nr:hypothetical protein [Oscillospiraceae bacterium]
MHPRLSNLVLGYHGCNKSTFDNVIRKHQQLKKSENPYDWLGHGIYFWENNPNRALEWAKETAKRKGLDVKDVAVVGAVLDLGVCLNLTDNYSLELVKKSYEMYSAFHHFIDKKLPKNKVLDESSNYLLRDLDCAVIEFLHSTLRKLNQEPFDSVRGVFVEGEELYPTSGFREKTHIQLCVINPKCIRGYFSPPKT